MRGAKFQLPLMFSGFHIAGPAIVGWPQFPVVLKAEPDVILIDAASGTTGNRKLRGATSQNSDLRCTQTLALKQQGSPVALETADLNRRCAGNDLIVSIQAWAYASSEGVAPAKIGR